MRIKCKLYTLYSAYVRFISTNLCLMPTSFSIQCTLYINKKLYAVITFPLLKMVVLLYDVSNCICLL